MSYRKYYRRKRKKYRFGKGKKTTLVSKVSKIIMNAAELKRYDVNSDVARDDLDNDTPILTDVFSPAQGNTDTNRNGDQLMLTKRFRFESNVICPDTGGLTAVCARIILFQWHPNTVPLLNEVLIPQGGKYYTDCLYNMDTRHMYSIIYDTVFPVTGYGSSKAGHVLRRIIYQPRMQSRVQFVNGTTTGTNKIYFAAVSDWITTEHQGLPPTIKYTIRTFFKDM